jgi:hypothetical protein
MKKGERVWYTLGTAKEKTHPGRQAVGWASLAVSEFYAVP